MRCLSLLTILFFALSAYSAKVIQVKGTKILIDLQGERTVIGQRLYILNSSSKKSGIATVVQAKGQRAIAELNKGKAEVSESVQFVGSGKTPEQEDFNFYSKKIVTAHRNSAIKIGAVLSINRNSMSTKQADATQPVPNSETVALSSTSFGITGTFDYNFNPWLVLRATLGYEPFNASGSAQFLSCDNLSSKNCTANINYLSGGGFVRYDFTKSEIVYWIAGGVIIKFPLSNSTTALRSEDIKTTLTYGFGGGIDYFLNPKNFIPASIEYQMFQSSDTVSANIFIIRGGYGWAF